MSRDGSGAALDVDDVVVLEAAYDHRDRVGFANMPEKRVAEPCAGARAAHEPRDIDEAHRRVDDALPND